MNGILYLSILIILFLIILSLVIYRDVLCPTVIIGIPWLISMCLLLFSEFDYDVNSIYFLYFVVGIIVFNIGFFLFSSGKKRVIKGEKTNTDIIVNNHIIRSIIVCELIIILCYSLYLFKYIISNYTYNILFTLKSADFSGLGYLNTFIIAFTAYVLFIYIKAKNFKNRKLILIIQIIIGSMTALLTLGRTVILLYCLLLLVIYAIIRKYSNRLIIIYLLTFCTIGIVFFSVYNLMKYPYLLENNTMFEVALNSFLTYTSSSLVAFQQWASLEPEFLYGGNTFRFFYAILASVGYDMNVQELTNTFINISNQDTSNVYTFYYYYAKDFGFTYALIIQFILGIIYGYLYRKMIGMKFIWIYLYALSVYPLVMQFFQDQYFSLLSTWIQYSIWGIVLFKTNLFLKKVN